MSTNADDLPHSQLRELIASRLRSAILDNEIKPGEWLRQEQLAEKFRVSQTPVREALKDLAADGLVEHVPYRGVRVVEFAVTDALDLYACRAFMEGLAAGYAAEQISSEELAELRRILREMELHPANDQIDEHRQLHRRFHQLIYTASHHTYLIHSLDQMWASFPTMMLTNFPRTARRSIGRGAAAMQEHRNILASLESRNGKAAGSLMKEHIEATAKSISAVLMP